MPLPSHPMQLCSAAVAACTAQLAVPQRCSLAPLAVAFTAYPAPTPPCAAESAIFGAGVHLLCWLAAPLPLTLSLPPAQEGEAGMPGIGSTAPTISTAALPWAARAF